MPDFFATAHGGIIVGGEENGFFAKISGSMYTKTGEVKLALEHEGGWSPHPALQAYFATPRFVGKAAFNSKDNVTCELPPLPEEAGCDSGEDGSGEAGSGCNSTAAASSDEDESRRLSESGSGSDGTVGAAYDGPKHVQLCAEAAYMQPIGIGGILTFQAHPSSPVVGRRLARSSSSYVGVTIGMSRLGAVPRSPGQSPPSRPLQSSR